MTLLQKAQQREIQYEEVRKCLTLNPCSEVEEKVNL